MTWRKRLARNEVLVALGGVLVLGWACHPRLKGNMAVTGAEVIAVRRVKNGFLWFNRGPEYSSHAIGPPERTLVENWIESLEWITARPSIVSWVPNLTVTSKDWDLNLYPDYVIVNFDPSYPLPGFFGWSQVTWSARQEDKDLYYALLAQSP